MIVMTRKDIVRTLKKLFKNKSQYTNHGIYHILPILLVDQKVLGILLSR